ncbi:MAG: NAD(P)H-hydrate epimerase, partial [Candidatus Micrarchaeia archaeon]
MQDLKWFANYTKKSLSSADMKAAELNAEALGVSALQQMESAGSEVARFVNKKFSKAEKVLVLCGTGNNGGDGFVAARHLEKRHKVVVAVLGAGEDIKPVPALLNFRALEHCAFVDIIENAEDRIEDLVNSCDLVVDAVFGTGFKGRMPRAVARVAKAVLKSRKPVVAVDLPSGLNADTGEETGAFKASYTVTFHKLKPGLLSAKSSGMITIADIGIPAEAELYAGPGDLYLASQPRSMTGNKYSNGMVLVIAGSSGFHGAPLLAANAAANALASLRTASGYVKLYVPKAISAFARSESPNIIVGELGNERIGEGNISTLEKDIGRCNAIAIGMGIGRQEDTLEAAAKIISKAVALGKKVVVDADAIYALRNMPALGYAAAITPHEAEFAALYKKPHEDIAARAAEVVELAKRLKTNVVLKGHTTVISNGTLVKLNTAETSALATMGTGDVLSGIIAGYAAAGADMFEASAAGVCLHSRIGDMLALEKGTHILASDIVERIPGVV